MSSRKTRPRRPRHHLAHYPPQSYADLTALDIQLLAPIFRQAPPYQTSAHAAYETDVRNKIAVLPSHLRCVRPRLSKYCATHRKINPLVIDSILHYIQDIVYPAALKRRKYGDKTIKILCDMTATWGTPSEYFSTKFDISYGKVSADFVAAVTAANEKKHGKTCGACKLASIADDAESLANLGGLVISSISRGSWKVSKRILWMEEWYRVVVDLDEKPLADVVKPMWDAAIELYRQHEPSEEESGRSHIDRYIEVAAEADHVRDHVSYVTPQSAGVTDSKAESYHSDALPFSRPSSNAHTPAPRFLRTPQPPRHTSSVYSQMDNWDQYCRSEVSPSVAFEIRRQSRETLVAHCAPIPSSVYSRGEDFGAEIDDDHDWNDSGRVESQIIESYRRRQQ